MIDILWNGLRVVCVAYFVFQVVWLAWNWSILAKVDRYQQATFTAIAYTFAVIFISIDGPGIVRGADALSDGEVESTSLWVDGGLNAPQDFWLQAFVISGLISFTLFLWAAVKHQRLENRILVDSIELTRRTPLKDLTALYEEYGHTETLNILRRKHRKG